jgi:2-enoate reductase
MIAGEPTSCSLNPSTGHEIDRPLIPLNKKRSLLVVGGGPAGIEAARVGVKRGFDVTLWEASDRLGGNLWPAAKPDFKQDILHYLNYLKDLALRLPVDIVFEKQATVGDIISFDADYVMLATGANMEPLPFNNSAKDHVLTAIQVLNGMEPWGEKVLVMGGGVQGCETAVYLARSDKKVTISTRRDTDALAVELFDHNNRLMLLQMITAANITVLSNAVPVSLEKDGIVVNQQGLEKKIAVDSLVFAGRLISENSLSKALENESNIFSIGDCVQPSRIMDAVWGGFNAVREIEK